MRQQREGGGRQAERHEEEGGQAAEEEDILPACLPVFPARPVCPQAGSRQ